MSFFKKLTDKFEDLKADLLDDKDKKQHNTEDSTNQEHPRDYNPRPVGTQIHESQYGYGQEQPQYVYQAPPPTFQGNNMPPLPPGWIAQFDQNNQRHYYLEQASGRTQWEPPVNHQSQNYGPPGFGQQSTTYDQNKSGKGGMLAAGAGGLAAGVVGGALLHDALDDSDEEHRVPVQQGYGDPGSGYGAAPALLPENDPTLSGSDRSSIKSAHEDLEEAQREYAQESDPSSSDREELEEAQEEYHEEVEEAYD